MKIFLELLYTVINQFGLNANLVKMTEKLQFVGLNVGILYL